jgi:hypothetical protein
MNLENKHQQRMAALTEARGALAIQYDIYPERLDYDEKNGAMVVEYVGDSSDGSTLLKENLLGILVGGAHGLREAGWPEDFGQVVGIAIGPVDVGMSEPQAIRWYASVDWLKETLRDEIPDAELQKRAMETAEWVYNDGSSEKADTNVSIVE